MAGALTVVGTPIGTLADLTDEALAALRAADIVCAEDTRHTRTLLRAYDVAPARLVSAREHNEAKMADRVREWVAQGHRVVVVTDAGMPTVSDPGARLVAAVAAAGHDALVAPGPDAATTALAVSGHGGGPWAFEGFLPAKGSDRARRLRAVAAQSRCVVLYEAPHRLVRTLEDLADAVPDRVVSVVKDATKRYERVWRGQPAQLVDWLGSGEPRGEYALVIEAAVDA